MNVKDQQVERGGWGPSEKVLLILRSWTWAAKEGTRSLSVYARFGYSKRDRLVEL